MIIYRYIVKEVVMTALATTSILLLIFMCTQFVHYLSQAAIGKYSAGVLMHLMALQAPYLLGLLFPAGLYFALLLGLGRLHSDREMMVLASCGMSQMRLVAITLSMAVVVSIIVGYLNLFVSPKLIGEQKELIANAKAAPIIESMLPGRFLADPSSHNIIYIEGTSQNHEELKNIFIFSNRASGPGKNSEIANAKKNTNNWSVVTAKQGFELANPNGEKFLIINDGHRYTGNPGHKDFEVTSFDKYKMRLSEARAEIPDKAPYMPLQRLLNIGQKDKEVAAEIQWRISMPLSVFLLALLAIPLSEVNPRQGKFAQLVPAVLVYIIYANMLFLGRSWLKTGKIPPWLGVWWLHIMLLTLALVLLAIKGRWWQLLKRKRVSAA